MFGPLALLLGVGALVLAFSGAGGGGALKKEYERMQALDAAEVMKVQELLQRGGPGELDRFASAANNLRQAGFPAVAAQLDARAEAIRKQHNIVRMTR